MRYSRLEDAPRLGDGEGALVAEDVDELRPAGERRSDVPADEVDELIVAPRPLGGQGVGGELRVDAVGRVWRLCRGEQLGLVLEREPVAGLDLESGRAVSEERVEAATRERRKLGFGRRARRADGRHDAATGRLDLEVAGAAEPRGVFAGALAG